MADHIDGAEWKFRLKPAEMTLKDLATTPAAGADPLTPREQAIVDGLQRVDPYLAGLFLQGLRLHAELSTPGVSSLLGHVTREVTNGVMRHVVTDASPGMAPREAAALVGDVCGTCGQPARGENNRERVATLLGLRSTHPAVKLWFRFQSSLSSLDHYREGGPDESEVRQAFEDLQGFLFMLLGGYFDTRRELDDLVRKEAPTNVDLNRLAKLLVRPAHRGYFFRELTSPGWIRPLTATEFLPNAPAVFRTADGFQGVAWPEGDFLRRAAAADPTAVADALARIPPELDNMFAWNIVAEIATRAPSPVLLQLGNLIIKAQKTQAFAGFRFHDKIVALIARLADDGQLDAALVIMKGMLQIRPVRVPSDAGDPVSPYAPKPNLFLTLARRYDFGLLLERALPTLIAADPVRLSKILLRRLESAVLTARQEGWDDHDSHWALRLSDVPEVYEEDARALLAHATARALIAAASKDRSSLVAVLHTLKACDWSDVCARLSALTLASSEYASQDEADALIDSDEAAEPRSRKAEMAAAVRVLFSKASSQAKAGFVRRIEAGPQWGREVDASTRHEWQRTRLRWFHARLPPELSTLAEALGVTPRVPDPQQRDLDEIGFHIGAASWGEQEVSPATPAEFGSMSAEEIVSLLEDWQERESALHWPEVSGAVAALREFATDNPRGAVAALQSIAARPSIPGRYLSALLSGLRHKLSQVDPALALNAISTVLRYVNVERTQTNEPKQHDELNWTGREALDLFIDGCSGNVFDLWSAEAVWLTLELDDVNAFPARDDRDVSNVDNLLSWAHSTHAGKVTRALIEAGLWHYRAARAASHDTSPQVDLAAVALVNPFIVRRLDAILTHSGQEELAAVLVTLGEHVPYVQLLAKDWLLEHQEILFERTTSLTGTLRPGWAGYVCLSQLVWSVFRDFRAWYSRALDWPAVPPSTGRSPQHIPDRQAAFHVTFAFLNGMVGFDDADRLLQRTFDRISVDDRNAVYWEIGHNLSAAGSLDRIPRILELWRWRLDTIKGVEPNDVAKESHGLGDLISNRSLPRDEAMPLGLRSLQGSRGQVRNETSIWPRLQEWSADDPTGTFALVDLAVRGSLAEPWALLTFEMVAPTLRNCLRSADRDTVANCRRLIQDMGERGLEEFGRLLVTEDSLE